ncbi:Branched-chain-amino-acid aminotransferase, mitochondrial [Diaporthe australafricana]|uniref:Branched-chain-amino-acid aminotransferase, mitochondrial n=1 Tax=Diaporthe australafricana TaxID=127596 RepID=A0ABR3WPF2_9PEZI
MGDYKVGPNHAPSIVTYARCNRHGVEQDLWLIGGVVRIMVATGMKTFAVIEERSADTDRTSEQKPVFERFTPPLSG